MFGGQRSSASEAAQFFCSSAGVHDGVTKTAQIAVARGIAESVAGTGVTVNSILAGPTESEGMVGFVEAMAEQQKKSKSEVQKEFFEHVRPSSLLKRFATVDEIAAMATYLTASLLPPQTGQHCEWMVAS